MRIAMPLSLSLLLVPALSLALAQDNDAEKLFRAMEKKIRSADALEFAFAYQLNKGKVTKGSLLLTKDNKMRLKISGYDGKRKGIFEVVADGKQLKTKGAKLLISSNGQSGVELGGESEWQTPKEFHNVIAALVSRSVMWHSLMMMPYLRDGGGFDPDGKESKMTVYDFKAGDDEKVGQRAAKVIRYKFGKGDGCRDDVDMTVWIDAETTLPLKRVFAMSRGEQIHVTETYREFTVDPKVDAKAFELPK